MTKIGFEAPSFDAMLVHLIQSDAKEFQIIELYNVTMCLLLDKIIYVLFKILFGIIF